KTALLVQVLKAYGKEHITDEIVAKIASVINFEDLKKIMEETRNTTEWIAGAIFSIFQKKQEMALDTEN
ncbi:MAG: hypothetical protein J6B12_01870, partial [Clostridia bacterium]|nr:hypothetical protein [Clostridia bacterium]